MTDKTNGKTEVAAEEVIEEPVEINAIAFEFESFASANFRVVTQGKIVPMQLLALSSWLEFEGKSSLAHQKAMVAQAAAEAEAKAAAEAQRNKIETPGNSIILPSGR